jgi:hypothetical protein
MSARARRPGTISVAWRAVLLAPAAFAVHQLRYELAYGAGARLELQRTGHSYLHSVVPWLVAALAVATGGFLARLGSAFAGRTSPRAFSASFATLWLSCTVALLAIFAGQELLEGVFLAGHPAGLAAVAADGGWWALPVAACVGLVLAALLHGARWIVDAIEARHRTRRTRGTVPAPAWPVRLSVAIDDPLVPGCGSRGPPRAF